MGLGGEAGGVEVQVLKSLPQMAASASPSLLERQNLKPHPRLATSESPF